MPLPNDISRCHDSGCNEKEECARWIERTAKGDTVAHTHSLFPYDIPLGDKCPMRIKHDDTSRHFKTNRP